MKRNLRPEPTASGRPRNPPLPPQPDPEPVAARPPSLASEVSPAPIDPSVNQPLLTIAIPTWNRADLLTELLSALAPQLEHLPVGEVEVLISDNGSTDATSDVVAHFSRHGLSLRYHCHPVNIGSDANFLFAFTSARGRYLWLFSDDDIIVPGAVDSLLSHLRYTEFDLVYATSYAFRSNWKAERRGDPMGRSFHILTSPHRVMRVVNIMFTFISGIIVNKARFEDLRRSDPTVEEPSAFLGTNLTQLSWTLPLLRHHRRSLILWDRPVAGRIGNGGGYSIGHVFGKQLAAVTARCLPRQPQLSAILLNDTLRRWFPSQIIEIRDTANQSFSLDQAEEVLRRTFGSNPRFWIFTWPILALPLPLARFWLRLCNLVSKLIYILEIPSFWRKQIK